MTVEATIWMSALLGAALWVQSEVAEPLWAMGEQQAILNAETTELLQAAVVTCGDTI